MRYRLAEILSRASRIICRPSRHTLKGKRDRAILAVFLFHAIRRAELCGLRVEDYGHREGVKHLTIHGKGGKIRYIPAHARAVRLIEEYLHAAGHRAEADFPLFRSVAANVKDPRQRLNPGSV